MVKEVCRKLNVSERWGYRVLRQARSTQRHRAKVRDDEDALTGRIGQLASCYMGGMHTDVIMALLGHEGWPVNHKWVENRLETRRAKSA